ncbi:MAG: ElyC/SanA/YdcF family protein [Spirochaetota bacterium]|nr:ElyC/SanA/YdcF family protein [Spirochaetota bacterium]
MKKILKPLLFILSVFCILCFVFALAINIYMFSFTKNYIFSELEDVPTAQASMILGAGVSTTGTISLAARDRVEATMELYHTGKSEKVIISGDHGRKNYDEVNSMKNYIKNMHHIADEDIFLDHAGFSTYESMYRGRDVFLMDNVIVISQEFHLPRAIYIARKLGLNAVGYVAKEITPFTEATHTIWNIREFLARVKSFFLVTFDIKPTYLGETIPISGDGRKSWD